MPNWYLQFDFSRLGCQRARVQPAATVPNEKQQPTSFRETPELHNPIQQMNFSILQNKQYLDGWRQPCMVHGEGMEQQCLIPNPVWWGSPVLMHSWASSVSSMSSWRMPMRMTQLLAKPGQQQPVDTWSLRAFHGGVWACRRDTSCVCSETWHHTRESWVYCGKPFPPKHSDLC